MKTVEYIEEYGAVSLPEGFAEKLMGKTVEEQMEHYRITESVTVAEYSYGELDRQCTTDSLHKLEEYKHCRALVLKDGIIVGVIMKGCYKEESCLVGDRICVYSVSEDDGAGSYDRDDYAWLVCT